MEQPSAQARVLKEAREKKGISLQAVHEGTKIPLDILKAMEEGYKVRTLSPFYYKGFLKMYAQYMGIDVSQIQDEKEVSVTVPTPTPKAVVKEEIPKSKPTSRVPLSELRKSSELNRAQGRGLKLALAGLALVLILFIAFKLVVFIVQKIPYKKSSTVTIQKSLKDQAQKAKKVKASLDALEKEKSVKANVGHATASSAAAVHTIDSDNTVIPPDVKNVNENADSVSSAPVDSFVENTAVTKPVPAVSKNTKKVTLTAKAKKSIWLQVKEDEAVVFQSTLKKGMSESWSAQEQIEVSGRNLNQLEFELNGRLLGTLGREDRAAKKVIATKDGLNVEK